MIAQWKCSLCPTVGHLTPKMEPVKETHETEINGQKVRQERIKMTTIKTQDTHTGKMHDHPVPVMKDLGTRITGVQLRVGDEMISVQLCHHCFEKFRPNFSSFWHEMEKIANGT